MTLSKLYSNPSEEFIHGFTAALEYYATMARISLTLYGRPITREELELEKQRIVNEFTEREEIIKL